MSFVSDYRFLQVFPLERPWGPWLSLLTLFLTLSLISVNFYTIKHGSIPPVTISQGNPQDKSSPSCAGLGNCLRWSCPRGRGWDKSVVKRFFVGNPREFVLAWLEQNNLSKSKPIFEGKFI